MKEKSSSRFLQVIVISISLWFIAIWVLPPSVAYADTNCREVARNTQTDLVVQGTKKQLTTGEQITEHFNEVFLASLNAYPECKPEIEVLWDWNRVGDANELFPFPKSGDPKTFPLGPVSWWWDTIYNRLLGGSFLLMIFFGWELFLMPFPLIIGTAIFILRAPFLLMKQLLISRRRRS